MKRIIEETLSPSIVKKPEDLTPDEITKIAKLDLAAEPLEVQILRIRLLLCYYTQVKWIACMNLTGRGIKDNRLYIYNPKMDTFKTIPLHPILVQLFKNYDNNMLAIPTNNVPAKDKITRRAQNIVRKAGITQKICKTLKRNGEMYNTEPLKYQVIYPYTFYRSGYVNMIESGFSKSCIAALSGWPSEEIGQSELNDAFSSPFYESLQYLQLEKIAS